MESVKLVLAIKWLEYLNRFIIGRNGVLILNCNGTLKITLKINRVLCHIGPI